MCLAIVEINTRGMGGGVWLGWLTFDFKPHTTDVGSRPDAHPTCYGFQTSTNDQGLQLELDESDDKTLNPTLIRSMQKCKHCTSDIIFRRPIPGVHLSTTKEAISVVMHFLITVLMITIIYTVYDT